MNSIEEKEEYKCNGSADEIAIRITMVPVIKAETI